MNRQLSSVYVLIIAGLMAVSHSTTEAADRKETAWPDPRPLGSDIPSFRPPQKPQQGSQSSIAEEPTGAIVLQQALALALLHNPELVAFSWEVRARAAEKLQAGLWPNPAFSASLENVAGSGSFQGMDQAQTTVGISQLIEFGGKRANRVKVAALSRDLAGWEYEIKRLEVFSQVSRAFIAVLAAQERLTLAEETVQLAEQVTQAVSEKVEAGTVSPVEEVKAQIALSSAQMERHRAQRELDIARKRLAATWGGMTARFQRAEGNLSTTAPIPPLTQFVPLLDQNPELARWGVEILQQQAAIDLEQSKAVPDVTLSGGYRRLNSTSEPDESAVVVEASLPLPLFNRNQGAIGSAQARLAKAQAERRDAAVRLTTRLVEAYQVLSTTQSEVTTLFERVVPGATRVFEAVDEGYRIGKFGFLDVLDAQRTLAAARTQALDARIAHHNAVADVEQLIGTRLEAGQPSAHSSSQESSHATTQ